jgi:hypothetical protein
MNECMVDVWLSPRVDLQYQQTAQAVVAQLVSAVDPTWIAAAKHAEAQPVKWEPLVDRL